MKLKASVVIAAFFAVTAHAKALTYTVNHSIQTGTLAGTITTDGTLGTLVDANVTTWNLTITSGAFVSNLTSLNSDFDVGQSPFSATSSGLFFDFSAQGYAYFAARNGQQGLACMLGSNHASCGHLSSGPGSFSLQPNYPYGGTGAVFQTYLGNVQIASAEELSAVPLPGALPLFASALGLGGFFGWKRKRKAAMA